MSSPAHIVPGPASSWKVMPHPLLGSRHQFHQARFIVSGDALVEIYDHNPDVRNQADWDSAWGLRNGVIICELRDSFRQGEYANLIAAAPALLAACRAVMKDVNLADATYAPEFHQMAEAIRLAEARA